MRFFVLLCTIFFFTVSESTRFSLWGVDGGPNLVRWCLSPKYFSIERRIIGHPLAPHGLRRVRSCKALSKHLDHASEFFPFVKNHASSSVYLASY